MGRRCLELETASVLHNRSIVAGCMSERSTTKMYCVQCWAVTPRESSIHEAKPRPTGQIICTSALYGGDIITRDNIVHGIFNCTLQIFLVCKCLQLGGGGGAQVKKPQDPQAKPTTQVYAMGEITWKAGQEGANRLGLNAGKGECIYLLTRSTCSKVCRVHQPLKRVIIRT